MITKKPYTTNAEDTIIFKSTTDIIDKQGTVIKVSNELNIEQRNFAQSNFAPTLIKINRIMLPTVFNSS